MSVPGAEGGALPLHRPQGCWLLSPAKEWIELKVGDALLLPRGDEHVLASAPGVPAVPIDRYSIEPVCENVYDVSERVRVAAKTLAVLRQHAFQSRRLASAART